MCALGEVCNFLGVGKEVVVRLPTKLWQQPPFFELSKNSQLGILQLVYLLLVKGHCISTLPLFPPAFPDLNVVRQEVWN